MILDFDAIMEVLLTSEVPMPYVYRKNHFNEYNASRMKFCWFLTHFLIDVGDVKRPIT